MEFPRIYLAKSVKDSFDSNMLYLFKNIDHEENAPSHYHVALKVSDNQYILLLMLTSQVEKRQRRYEIMNNEKAKGSVVVVDNESITFLEKQSCIDCNDVKLYTAEELSAKIDGDLKFQGTDIDKALRPNLVAAIKNSPLVKPRIKKLIS